MGHGSFLLWLWFFLEAVAGSGPVENILGSTISFPVFTLAHIIALNYRLLYVCYGSFFLPLLITS